MDDLDRPASSGERNNGLAERSGSEDLDADADAVRMLAFRDGDMAAFDDLFDRWFVPLLRYIDGIVRDSGRAEELAQDVFVRVHGARDRYEPTARFSTWLYRIATNLARNELRRPDRRLLRVEEGTAESERDREDAPPGIDEQVEARRMGIVVQRALDRLSAPQREALWLSQVEGLAHAEIAEILDTSVGSVKMLVRRARLALAEAVQEKGRSGIR